METTYYDDLIRKIEEKIDEGDYLTSQSLIDEELKMPYVPSDILEKLNYLKEEIKPYLAKDKKEEFLSEEQIEQYLHSSYQLGYKALEVLSKSNVRNYLPLIQKLLKEDSINHTLKCLLLEILVDQSVDQTVTFSDNDSFYNICPKDHFKVLQQKNIEVIERKLNTLLSNNPSFLNQAKLVLVNAAYDNYPLGIKDIDVDTYVFSIIRYVYLAYGDSDGWEQFIKYFDFDENNLIDFAF